MQKVRSARLLESRTSLVVARFHLTGNVRWVRIACCPDGRVRPQGDSGVSQDQTFANARAEVALKCDRSDVIERAQCHSSLPKRRQVAAGRQILVTGERRMPLIDLSDWTATPTEFHARHYAGDLGDTGIVACAQHWLERIVPQLGQEFRCK